MALGVFSLLCRALWWLYADGYFPQPFFYEPSDHFMDWFNTAYWAHDKGAYDTWLSIYPPLSFVALRLLTISSCYTQADGFSGRDCDWYGMFMIHFIFVMNIVLISLTYKKVDRRTALPRSFALAAGMPMLFALERGNILLLCFTTVLLAFGPLIRSARLKWLFAGLAVNFKVYLIAAVFAQLLRRRWLWAEGALIATIIVYIVSYGILGVGTPMDIYANITAFASGFIASQVLDIWYAVTYQPLTSLLHGETFPITPAIGSHWVEVGEVLFPTLTRMAQGAIVVAAAATWLRPEVVPTHRVAFLGICLAMISSEAGGYTEILIIFFVFMESWRGIARPVAIICCYILCLPGDISVGYIPPFVRYSYIGRQLVEVHASVGLGFFVRPGIVLLCGASLAAATIHDVWTDIRTQGWKYRWRFRRDWPILPWIRRPSRPVAIGVERGLSDGS